MKILKTITETRAEMVRLRREGRSIGFVPTMGYLHEGHLSLVEACRAENDIVTVSLFVNPAQFGPNEDFDRYPRDYERDIRLFAGAGADVLFFPERQEIYPADYYTYVEVEKLSGHLCGKSRPGHFRGVATVVLKLFNIITPDNAYFGSKDAQQAVIIKRMARDLNLPVNVKALPIVRDPDGLALSSRNVYLSPQDREAALYMSRALINARDGVHSGKLETVGAVRQFIYNEISKSSHAEIDYIAIVFLDSLEDAPNDGIVDVHNTLIAAAIKVGRTRLIDNFILGEI